MLPKRLSTLLFLTTVSQLTAPPARAETSSFAQLDRFVENAAAVYDYAGVVLVSAGEDILFQRAYGSADVALEVPNEPGTRFLIASLTKGFTARAVLLLRDRGALSLDDRLARFLPSYPRADEITLRQLLTHRAGIPSRETEELGADPVSLDSIVDELARLPLSFDPGTDEEYSNGGYVLLAKVVEVASGTAWAAFLQDELLRPHAMLDTGMVDSSRPTPRLATGYDDGPGTPPLSLPRPFHLSHKVGSGALYSTAEDLRRWGRWLCELLSHDPDPDQRLGWWTEERDGVEVVTESGRLAGFAADLHVVPSRGLVVVSLANIRTGAAKLVEQAALASALGDAIELPTLPPYAELDGSALRAAAGLYRYSDDLAVRLQVEGERLVAYLLLGGGEHRLPLTPRNDGELVDRSYYTTYSLLRAPEGRVTGLVFTDDGGNERRMQRQPD